MKWQESGRDTSPLQVLRTRFMEIAALLKGDNGVPAAR
jgi:hypothetical protein